jgi:two-component system response regulator YesN
VEDEAQRLACALKEYERRSACTVLIGIGQVKERVQDISVSYSEAEQLKSYRQLLSRHSLAGLTGKQRELGYDRDRVTNFLKYEDASKLESFVADYLSDAAAGDGDAAFYRHYLLMDLIAAASQFIHESGGDMQGLLQEWEGVESGIAGARELGELRRCAAELLAAVLRRRDQMGDKYSELLRKAKDYIAAHYDKPDISLQSVAHYVNVSPSHFSTIFSQETGQTFIDYLIQTRIQRAMELLRTTNARSYEIAAMVGYNDPHYFNSLFKRITGVTTRVFRSGGQAGGRV